MPRTVESIVENHRVARERRAAGNAVWDRTIDIKGIIRRDKGNESNAHVEAVAREVVELVEARVPTQWLDCTNDTYEHDLDDVLEGMRSLRASEAAEGDLVDEFNGWLDQLYDWADARRVWLG